MVKYSVTYFDDNNEKHLAFISSYEELSFLKERFDRVEIIRI